MSVAEPLIQASLIGEALDDGPVAVFVFDEDMHYLAANAYLCALLGYSRDELLRMRVTDNAVTEGWEQRARDLVARGTARHRAETRCKDGSTIELEFAARETRIAGMTVYVAVGWAA